ncbi:MAG: hypothetical protein JKY17_06630 [Magnetovibrio sp.]|nr:hypothetical protein [Magnetovibrio sp.]
MSQLSHDATASAKGLIYQLYLAVDWCFELLEGQSLFIERFGDLSVDQKYNIEIKHYDEVLTDAHINLWKTLNNWIQPEFDLSRFQRLILLTTQDIGKQSCLNDWEAKDANEKLTILRSIKDGALARFSTSQKVNKSTSLKMMEKAFEDEVRLCAILKKFEIISSQPMLEDKFEEIVQRHSKPIPAVNKERFIKALFGFVVDPEIIVNNQWEITYASFTNEVEN